MKLRQLTLTLLTALSLTAQAANEQQIVTQCTDGISLTSAIDYIITGTTPFATTGSINIQHEDAVVIFQGLRPANAKAYLSNITINGEKAVTGTNCWLEIYKNGTILYPHAELSYKPLTVYTDANFSGDSYNTFNPYTKYTTGSWVNNFKSFRLKRGYMATIATNPNGQGWSKVFIAQDEDLNIDFTQVNYGKYIAGREGFIRVFPWRNVTKKGTAGSPGQQEALNVTWKYGWDGGGWHDEQVEYIPQHHHEGWPSWSGINNLSGCNTVLGNNEPDNSGDDREQYIKAEEIESRMFGPNGSWQQQAYSGGLRIGSPAMSGDARGTWLSTFISLCEKYNCRIDFIADHCYWLNNGGNYWWQMDQTYNKYKRPIWITEWNYGANWTSWPGSDTSGSDANQTIELNAIKDIVGNLESHPHVERYAIYNWVQDCRTIVLNGKLTKAGEWYGQLKSNPAYSSENEYTMGWNYWSPSDLYLEFKKNNKQVTLSWTHLNGKQTDSVCVERKIVDDTNAWETIANLGMISNNTPSNNDNLSPYSGVVYYRIANHDSDGKTRYSNEVSITLGSAQGNDTFQHGKLTVTNLDAITTDFSEKLSNIPAIFMGVCTNKSSKKVNNKTNYLYPGNLITSAGNAKFSYQILPWTKQTDGIAEITKAEEIPFMAVKFGNYKYGELDCEVGIVKVNMVDTATVTFTQAFPDSVTPIILTELRNPTLKSNPISIHIWNVTNTGFKVITQYEEAVGSKSSLNQNLCYLAITPGRGSVLNEPTGIKELVATDTISADTFQINELTDSVAYILKNTYRNTIGHTDIVAGIGENSMYGTTYKSCTFMLGEDTLYFKSPKVFARCQTNNYPAAAILRKSSDIAVSDKTSPRYKEIFGANIKRQVDGTSTTTAKNNSTNGDVLGYVVIGEGENTYEEEVIEETAYELCDHKEKPNPDPDPENPWDLDGDGKLTVEDITTLIEIYLGIGQ
ncbi:MAG: hypothetical protein IJT97_07760 [Bacteroidaceae bacterium]|nr:hypothetical protein [Bacteroidaceae bacterium]